MTVNAPVHRELPRSDDVRHPHRFALYRFRALATRLIRRRWRLEIRGAENVPVQGPVIIIANHMGWLDGPLMAIVGPRPVHALTKTEMFTGALGRFLVVSGQIPVHRYEVDPLAVRSALRVLRDGHALGMFPEGTRGDGGVASVKGGAAYLALVTGAPVVPMVFLGTREYGGRNSSLPPAGSRLVLSYGSPRTFPRRPWPRDPATVRAVAEEQREMLLETLREAQAATGLGLAGPIPDKEDASP